MDEIIEIKSNYYTAGINLTRGGNCISLRNSKYNAKILREPNYLHKLDNAFLYGMPILYPVNRIHRGNFEFEGRTYTFPINEPSTNCHLHGELHNTEFKLIDKGDDFVLCQYVSSNKQKGFMHKFSITMRYEVSNNGLCQNVEIKNLSDINMPNFLGFHTTFNIPFLNESDTKDIAVLTDVKDEIERDMSVYLPTGKILPVNSIMKKLKNGKLNPFECMLSRHYKIGKKKRIEIKDLSKKIKVVYENDEKYKFRLIYNGNANEYICLEPMTCMANCQNAPFDREYAGFDYIEPGKSKNYISKIYIEEGI